MKTILCLVVAMSVGACAMRKQHVIEKYGSSYEGAFGAQVAHPESPKTVITGLDSQEAAIISDTYRVSLAPEKAKVAEEPVLIVTPQRSGQPQLPAPSVPKE